MCCRQLIYNYPEQLFADAGVMAIEHADFEGVERLALVTGEFYSIKTVMWNISFSDKEQITVLDNLIL